MSPKWCLGLIVLIELGKEEARYTVSCSATSGDPSESRLFLVALHGVIRSLLPALSNGYAYVTQVGIPSATAPSLVYQSAVRGCCQLHVQFV